MLGQSEGVCYKHAIFTDLNRAYVIELVKVGVLQHQVAVLSE